MTHVLVAGGGASGLAAAKRLIEAGLEVTVVESGPRLGGNVVGLDVRARDGAVHRVDVGVSDFNRRTFKHVRAVIEELGLPHHPIAQSASFARADGAFVWGVYDGQPAFGDGAIDRDALLADNARFKATALEVLEDPRFDGFSAGAYLRDREYGDAFRYLAFHPRASGCFPMPDANPDTYAIQSIVAFWRIHGIVGEGVPDRAVVTGGMSRYIAALGEWLVARGCKILTTTRLLGVLRRAGRVEARIASVGDEHRTVHADYIVLAVGAHDVVPVLEDATPEERALFARFRFQRARVVAHHDPRLMPRDRERWAAFNYYVGPRAGRPTITFHPNVLAGLAPDVPPVFVTMNPQLEPAPESVLLERFFVHPIGDGETARTAAAIERLQGHRRTWFCGAYMAEPWVHEPAFASGVRAAEQLIEHELHAVEQAMRSIRIDASLPVAEGESVFVVTASAPGLELVATVHSIAWTRIEVALPNESDARGLEVGAPVSIVMTKDEALTVLRARLLRSAGNVVTLRLVPGAVDHLGADGRVDNRRHARATLRIACELLLDGIPYAQACTANLGCGGAELLLPEAIAVAPGSRGTCTLRLPGDELRTFECAVVHTSSDPARGLRVGVTFRGLEDPLRARLDRFVHFLQRTRVVT